MAKYFILSKDFDKLSIGATVSVKIYSDYDGEGEKSSYDSQKVTKLTEYEVGINEGRYELLNKDVEVETVSQRKPHPAVKKNWDGQAGQIKQFIQEQEAILDKYASEDLKGIRTNLFVDLQYANVVETKITELRRTLASLTLRVEKLKDRYENVRDTTTQNTETEKAPDFRKLENGFR